MNFSRTHVRAQVERSAERPVPRTIKPEEARFEPVPRAAVHAGSDRRSDAAGTPLVSAPQMLVAMFVAPLAWLVEMAVAQTQATSDCVAGGRFALNALPWTPLTVALTNLLCVGLAGFGMAVAWRNLRRTRRMPWRSIAHMKGTRAESDWFLSRVCTISSTMFGVGLVATGVGAALISPCSQWW